jgi:hypothetical protein
LIAGNRLLAVLIVAATVAFAIGVSIERSQESGETSAETAHVEGGGAEGVSPEGVSSDVQAHSDSSSETLLGINPESIPLLIVAIVVSLTLAVGVWCRPDLSILLIVVALAMLAFAGLDVREFFHQLDASRGGLAVLVALIALLHVGAAVLAIRLVRSSGPQAARPG